MLKFPHVDMGDAWSAVGQETTVNETGPDDLGSKSGATGLTRQSLGTSSPLICIVKSLC